MHTPGQWKVVAAEKFCRREYLPILSPDEREEIAWVMHLSEDNARLVAAAPELLEALVYLVEAIESSMHGEESLHTWQCAAPDHGKCTCDAYPAMDVARAGIAKAKGDSTQED